MKKHTFKSGLFSVVSFVSFLLIVSFLLFLDLRGAQDVSGNVGTLNLNATIGSLSFPGGIWNSSGNVGIGNTAPAAGNRLDITGKANMGTLAIGGASITASVANLNSVTGLLGTAAFTASTAYATAAQANATHTGDVTGATALTIGASKVLTGMILDGTITGADILNGTILTGDIGANTITGANILDSTILTGDIGADTILAADIAADVIGDSELFNGGAWNITSALGIMGGNVGIGTTSPGAKLEVKQGVSTALTLPLVINNGYYLPGTASGIGFLTDGTASYAKGALVYTSNGSGWNKGHFQFLQNSADDTSLVTLSNAVMTIQNSGNVGIGTTGPGYKLDVQGGAINASGGLYWNGQSLDSRYMGITSGTTNYVTKFTGATTIGNSTIFDNGTNVGIGTTAPGYKLDVQGDTNFGGHMRWNTAKDFKLIGTGDFTFDFADGDGNDYWAVWDPVHSEILTARNNGNVGIGTTAPDKKLRVWGGAVGITGSGVNGTLVLDTVAGTSLLGTNTNTNGIAINVSGNVGIGTTAPGTKLDVGGTGRFSGNVTLSNLAANRFVTSGTGGLLGTSASLAGLISSLSDVPGSTGTLNLVLNTNPQFAGIVNMNQMRIYNNTNPYIQQDTAFAATEINLRQYNSASGKYAYYGLVGTAGQLVTGSVSGDVVIRSTYSPIIFTTDGGVTQNMTIENGGYVGIGTSTPGGKLDVSGALVIGGNAAATDGTGKAIELITDTNFGGVNDDHTGIRMVANDMNGWGTVNLTIQTSTNWKTYATKYKFNGSGTAYADTGWNTFSPYLSYNYVESDKTSDDYELGDIVSLKQNSRWTVSQSNPKDSSSLHGIIVHPEGFASIPKEMKDKVWNKAEDINKMGNLVPVAHLGEASTKITSINGNTSNGDPITSSWLSGIGMKTTKPGTIVGKALESTENWNNQNCPVVHSIDAINWPEDDGSNPAKPCFRVPVSSLDNKDIIKSEYGLGDSDYIFVGKIMVFVNVSWYDPDVYFTDTGDLKIVDDSGSYSLKGKDGSTVDRIGAFAKLIVAKIQAGLIETKKLIVDDVDILKKLNELSLKVDSQQKQIEELQRKIESLKK